MGQIQPLRLTYIAVCVKEKGAFSRQPFPPTGAPGYLLEEMGFKSVRVSLYWRDTIERDEKRVPNWLMWK